MKKIEKYIEREKGGRKENKEDDAKNGKRRIEEKGLRREPGRFGPLVQEDLESDIEDAAAAAVAACSSSFGISENSMKRWPWKILQMRLRNFHKSEHGS